MVGSAGTLFNRLGKLALTLKNTRSSQSTLLTSMTDTTNGVVAQYNGESDIQALMGSSYQANLTALEAVCKVASNMAVVTSNRMCFRDNPRINQTLTNQNILASLQEIIRQMKSGGYTVQACAIGSTIANNPSGNNTGNGVINFGVKRPSDGLVCENTFAETVQVLCNSDSYLGNATAGNEGFIVTGQGNQTDLFAFNWPLGSNASIGINTIDGNANVSSGNLLTYSGFNNWTSNVPTNWTLVAGVAGTNIIQNVSQQYDGTACVQIAGDGTTNFNLTQTFNLAAGTTGTLSPLTQYSFNIFMKRDGTPAANGTLTVDLIDGSNVTIADANGVANTFNIDLTALTATYASFLGVFRLPEILPSTMKIRMRLTGTGLTNGRSVFADKASLGIMAPLYVSGPAIAMHAGSVNFEQGDFGTVVTTNNRGGAADGVSTFQCAAMRMLPMMQNNLLLPSSNSPNISDSLIG